MNRRKALRRYGLTAAALLAALLAVLLPLRFWHSHAASASRPAPAEALPDNVIATAPGWVDAQSGLLRLGVRSEGSVESVAVHEGDLVARDALLLQLDTHELQLQQQAAQLDLERRRSEIAAVQEQLARARERLIRLRPLVAQQAEPADELRGAQAQLSDLQAQARQLQMGEHSLQLQLQILQERGRRQEIRAPAQGQVLRVLAHPGDAVAPGTPLLWFAAAGPRIVRAELDERVFAQVSSGMTAQVMPEFDDSKVYEARVLRVARAVGPVQALPELRPNSKDDRVVECLLSIDTQDLLIGQRVIVRIFGGH